MPSERQMKYIPKNPVLTKSASKVKNNKRNKFTKGKISPAN